MHFKEINIKNRVFNYYLDYLIKVNKLETKNVLINEKNYKDLVIYFTRYDCWKSVKMLSLHYHESLGKLEEYESKKYLMVDNYMDCSKK